MLGIFANEWGAAPWRVAFPRAKRARPGVPALADFVVIGGGFSGLSAAAWLARLAPGKTVVVVEAAGIGAGASGRTGGMTLAETAGGDLPGLGDVLAGFAEILRELRIRCDFLSHGAWEIGREHGLKNSEISWKDAGRLRVVHEVPGGTVDAGKLLRGLARAAMAAGVALIEGHAVTALKYGSRVRVMLGEREISAGQVLIATNAQSLELAGLQNQAAPKLTMGVATEPLSARTIKAIGMASRRPFYTVDLPYLWGRLLRDNRAIFGCGLVTVKDWEELHAVDVRVGHAAELNCVVAGTGARVASRVAEGEIWIRVGRADFVDGARAADSGETAREERDVSGWIQRARGGVVRVSGAMGSAGDAGEAGIAAVEQTVREEMNRTNYLRRRARLGCPTLCMPAGLEMVRHLAVLLPGFALAAMSKAAGTPRMEIGAKREVVTG